MSRETLEELKKLQWKLTKNLQIIDGAGDMVWYAEGQKDLPLLTAVIAEGQKDLPLLTSVVVQGQRDLPLLSSVLAVGIAEFDPAVLLFNLHLKTTISVDLRFKKWNDITNALISTTTVTIGALDIGLKTTRDHFQGSTVTRDTLKVGTDGTAVNFATDTDVITVHTTWTGVTKSKPASNQVAFDPGEPPATRARPAEPAAGGSNTLTIREGAITSYARGTTSITLTWSKDSMGVDTVKESLFLEATVTFSRSPTTGASLLVDNGLTELADALLNNSGTMYTHAGVGTGSTAPAAGNTALGAEVGSRTSLTKSSHDAGGFIASRIKIAFANADVDNSAIREIGGFDAASAGTLFGRAVASANLNDISTKHIEFETFMEMSR